jgi:hypothetical protein
LAATKRPTIASNSGLNRPADGPERILDMVHSSILSGGHEQLDSAPPPILAMEWAGGSRPVPGGILIEHEEVVRVGPDPMLCEQVLANLDPSHEWLLSKWVSATL